MAQTPQASPGATPLADPGACDGLAEYSEMVLRDVYAELTEDEVDFLENTGGVNPMDLRPSELRTGVSAFDTMATVLEDVPPDAIPLAAKPFHEAFITYAGAWASLFNALVGGGLIGALGYQEVVEEATAELERARDYGERMCGDDWYRGVWWSM